MTPGQDDIPDEATALPSLLHDAAPDGADPAHPDLVAGVLPDDDADPDPRDARPADARPADVESAEQAGSDDGPEPDPWVALLAERRFVPLPLDEARPIDPTLTKDSTKLELPGLDAAWIALAGHDPLHRGAALVAAAATATARLSGGAGPVVVGVQEPDGPVVAVIVEVTPTLTMPELIDLAATALAAARTRPGIPAGLRSPAGDPLVPIVVLPWGGRPQGPTIEADLVLGVGPDAVQIATSSDVFRPDTMRRFAIVTAAFARAAARTPHLPLGELDLSAPAPPVTPTPFPEDDEPYVVFPQPVPAIDLDDEPAEPAPLEMPDPEPADDGTESPAARDVPVTSLPIEELPIEHLPIADLPLDSIPAADLPFHGTPVEDLPGDDAPTQYLPVPELGTPADVSAPADAVDEPDPLAAEEFSPTEPDPELGAEPDSAAEPEPVPAPDDVAEPAVEIVAPADVEVLSPVRTRRLLAIHVGGAAAPWSALSRHLGDAVEMNVLLATVPRGSRPTTIPDLASACLRQIPDGDPQAPFVVAGYGAGAMVAYELACQLLITGAKVDLLISVNGPTPAFLFPPEPMTKELVLVRTGTPTATATEAARQAGKWLRKRSAETRTKLEPWRAWAQEGLLQKGTRVVTLDGEDPTVVAARNTYATGRFPVPPVPVLVLRTAALWRADAGDLGWSALTRRTVRVTEVEGMASNTPATALQEPAVQGVAAAVLNTLAGL